MFDFIWNPIAAFKIPESILLEKKFKGKTLTHLVVALSALSIFFFGYDQGLMSGVNSSPDYVNRMKFGYVNDDATVTVTDSTKQGGIVAIYYFGTLWGCLFGGIMSEKVGRIKSIAFGALIAIIGAALQTSAQQTSWMCGARFFNGIGTGILNAVVPVYTSETAEATSRGAYICLEFTLNIFGVVVAYWLEFGLSYIDGGYSAFRWRFPIAFQIIPLLVLFFACWCFPESPRWLIGNHENERAKELLINMRGEEDGTKEFEEIIISLSYEEASALSSNYFSMIFDWYKGDDEQVSRAKKLHISRRVILVVWLQILQEWIGIAGITVYQIDIFSQAGFDGRKSQWLSGLNNIFYCFSTLFAVYTIDRWGRRFTCFWGAVGQGISLFLAGGFSKAQQNNPNNKSFGAASAAFVFIYTSIFGATWLMVPWIIPAEYFPLEVRAQGNALGVAGWSIGNGWLTLLCPVMFNAIAEKTLYIFGACNFLGIIVVYLFYPETANRTLEDIDFLFSSPSWLASKSEFEFQKYLTEKNDEIARFENNKPEKEHLENDSDVVSDAA